MVTKVKGSVWDSGDNGLAVNVKDFGAKGDGETNDTLACQAAIDSLPSTGGEVYFPPGNYRVNLILTNGNQLVGSHSHASANSQYVTRLTAAVAGWVIQTNEAVDVEGSSVKGFSIHGLGALSGTGGIKIHGGRKNWLKDLAFNNFSDSAIMLPKFGVDTATTTVNGTVSMERIFAQNCLLDDPASEQGIIDINNTDSNLYWVEVAGRESNGNLIGVRYGNSSAHHTMNKCLPEFCDIGILLDTTSSDIDISTTTVDNSYLQAIVNRGNNNKFTMLNLRGASVNNSAVYNVFDLSGSRNKLVGITYDDFKSIGSNPVNFISETLSTSSQEEKNVISGCSAKNISGVQFTFSSLFGGSSLSGIPKAAKPITAGTTIDVDNTSFVRTAYAGATTVTDFINESPGQELKIMSSNTNTTIEHNSSYVFTNTGADKTLTANRVYTFTNYSGVWYESI